MDKRFGNLKAFFRVKTPAIDGFVCKLHYQFTLAVLLAFSILVTGKAYIGDPIDCISKDDIPSDLLDIFCWIHPTFSVVDAWKKTVGNEVAYPGVHKHVEGDDRVYHSYYQWVSFLLFIQALMFYVPRFIWRNIEGHRVKDLVMEFDNPIVSAKKKEDETDLVVEYLEDNIGNHRVYTLSYTVMEILNFINVLGQIFVTDVYLGGEFTTYGLEVFKFTEWDWTLRFDPMIKVFPRVTKCTFYRFGSSGDVQKHDALCVIPINVVNEKVYIFLWFWFIILAILTFLALLYRIVVLLSSKARYWMLRIRCRNISNDVVKDVVNAIDRYDWLLLTLLCKNMAEGNFKIIMEKFASKVGKLASKQVELESYPEKKIA